MLKLARELRVGDELNVHGDVWWRLTRVALRPTRLTRRSKRLAHVADMVWVDGIHCDDGFVEDQTFFEPDFEVEVR